jgi:hypothetical protein
MGLSDLRGSCVRRPGYQILTGEERARAQVMVRPPTEAQQPSKVSAQLPVTGLPGQNASHIVVPIFPQGDPRHQGGPVGLPGDYEVTFTFNRPGYPLSPEKSITASDNLEGDSHLKITDIFRLETYVDGTKYTFEGKPNSRGFLASLTVYGHAANLKDARDRFYRALTPTLSNFSLRWDVPLVIYQIDVTEARRGTRQITNKNPFSEVSVKGIFRFPITKGTNGVWCSVQRSAD